MAATKDLTVRLLGDSSDLQDATRDAEKGVDRLGATLAGLGVAGAAGGAALAVGFAGAADLEEGRARLQAQLGLSADDAAQYGELAGSVYADNFGADMTSVNEAIRTVQANLGDVKTVGEDAFRGATEAALTLADVMGVEVAESTQAAAALVKNGLAKDSTEAFDIITAGFQNGANKAGDFLATLTEYSPQFSKFGFTGEQTMSLLSAGLQAGARDSDVLSDAFKEFNLQALDLGGTAPAGFKAIGLDAKAAAAAIAEGGSAAGDMTTRVLQGLANIEDPLQQNAAGVALFGTTWEDTMRTIIDPMAEASGQSIETAGSVDQMTAAMGTTGKARVETLRREFDAWVQTQIAGSGASSTAVAAIGSFGPAAVSMAGSLGMAVAGLAALNLGAGVARVTQLAGAAATGVWTGAQWLLNAALTANPIGLVVVAIAALVAAIVIAYRNSETFRAIVQAAMRGVVTAFGWVLSKVMAVFGWVRANWPLLLAIITGPIGLAVRFVTRHFDTILTKVRSIPAAIRGAFSNAGTLLVGAGRSIVEGLWSGIQGLTGWLAGQVRGFVERAVPGPIRDALGIFSPSRVARDLMGHVGEGMGLGLTDGEPGVVAAATGLADAAIQPITGITPAQAGRALPGGASVTNVYITGPLITDDRALIQRIEAAKRGTGRARTIARVGA